MKTGKELLITKTDPDGSPNSQLTKKTYGIILENKSVMFKFPTTQSKQIAFLQEDVIFQIMDCKPDWCKVNLSGLTGWIETKSFWGSKD